MFKKLTKLFQSGKKAAKSAKPTRAAKLVKPPKTEKPIGKVTHFYGDLKVAIVKFKIDVKKGTPVRFKGATTDFAQALESMQYDHKPIAKAPKGKLIGIKVKKKTREGDAVYLDK